MVFKLYDINNKKDITLKNISFTDKQKINRIEWCKMHKIWKCMV